MRTLWYILNQVVKLFYHSTFLEIQRVYTHPPDSLVSNFQTWKNSISFLKLVSIIENIFTRQLFLCIFQKYFETFGRYILTNFLTQLEFIAGTIETKKQLNVIEIVL